MSDGVEILLSVAMFFALIAGIEALETWRDMKRPLKIPRVVIELFWSALLVALATAVARAIGLDRLADADVVMLYLAVIMVVAVRFRRTAAVAASALSVAAYDFFFIEPYHTLSVDDSRHLLSFAMMFAVGLFVSSMSKRVQDALLRKKTDEIKSSLLSAVSHDLRTPLASIAGAATTLRDDGARIPDDDKRALLTSIAEESFHLERLIESLLDMSRVDAGALRLKREWVPLDELIGSALARTELRLGTRAVRTFVGDELVHVDATLFERALVNLLDNAAKHTPATTIVEVRATRTKITISDDGPGLPAGVDVFEKFVRGTASSGTGLGLAIARGLVAAHGGTLTAIPRKTGAAFCIELPDCGAPPASVPA